MNFTCSGRNIIANVTPCLDGNAREEEGIVITFTDMRLPLSDVRRETSITIPTFPLCSTDAPAIEGDDTNCDFILKWNEYGDMLLIASKSSGFVCILHILKLKYKVFKLFTHPSPETDGHKNISNTQAQTSASSLTESPNKQPQRQQKEVIDSIEWIPPGCGPSLMAGCQSFLITTNLGRIMFAYQTTSQGSFHLTYHLLSHLSPTSPSSTAGIKTKPLPSVSSPPLALFCCPLFIGGLLYILRIAADKLVIDLLSIWPLLKKFEEKTVLEAPLSSRMASIPFQVEYDRNNNCVFLFSYLSRPSTALIESVSVQVWNLEENKFIESGALDVSEKVKKVLFYSSELCIFLLTSGELITINLDKMAVYLPEAAILSPLDKISFFLGDRPCHGQKLNDICFSSNKCLIYGLIEEGPFVASWQFRPIDPLSILDAVYQNQSFSDLLSSLRHNCDNVDSGLGGHGDLLDILTERINPSIRRSHQCGLLLAVSNAIDDNISSSFYQSYLVINHFWESMIAASPSLRDGIDVLEENVAKVIATGGGGSVERLQHAFPMESEATSDVAALGVFSPQSLTEEMDKYIIEPATLVFVSSLATLYLSHIKRLFSPSHQEITSRHMNSERFTGRILSSLLLYKTLQRTLRKITVKYVDNFTLQRYFANWENDLNEPLVDELAQKICKFKSRYAPEASTVTGVVDGGRISGSDTGTGFAELFIFSPEKHSVVACEPISGISIDSAENYPCCPTCRMPLIELESNQVLSHYIVDHWTRCCPCGTSYPISHTATALQA